MSIKFNAITAMLLTIAIPASAELTVLGDHGGRASGMPDIRALMASQDTSHMSRFNNVLPQQPSSYQPVMTPGRITPMAHDHKHVTQPFFIVDADELSTQWLIANESYLASIDAIGFISSHHSQDTIHRIDQLTRLTVVSTNTNALADLFTLSHYPVLITQKEIKQ